MAVMLPGALALVLVLAWARQVTVADPSANSGLDPDSRVAVSRGEWMVFQPKDDDPVVGLIFYPGGKADPIAYAPILHDIAAAGFLVVLTPMPLNLAVLSPQRATRVMARFPQIERWAIGGHSLGGVTAAGFAKAHRDSVAGLLLWAAYPAQFTDLSGSKLPVLSISAGLDALATPDKVRTAQALLPPDTRYVRIEGGDHWNFGNFGPERATAKISRQAQQQQIVEVTSGFLGSLAPQ